MMTMMQGPPPPHQSPEPAGREDGGMGKKLPVPAPRVHYFRCVDDANQPAGYVGEWPARGRVYAGHVKPSAYTGEPHIYLDGLWAAAPWGAFAAGRFVHLATFHLN